MKFDYDFDVDGGAIGSLDLRADIEDLKAGLVIVNAYVLVETALTSAGTPTITLGNTDADGFFVDIYSELSAGTPIQSGEVAGALIWDDTQKAKVAYEISSDTDVKMEIGTAAVTAGKFSLYLECINK